MYFIPSGMWLKDTKALAYSDSLTDRATDEVDCAVANVMETDEEKSADVEREEGASVPVTRIYFISYEFPEE